MKERRSLYSNFGPNEALIKEYQDLFDKISIHKGSKYSVIEQLKNYKLLINESLITAKKLANKSWRSDYKKIEDEVAGYLLSTFKFDYLYIEFTSIIPNKIESENDSEFEKKLNDPNKIPISILLQLTNIPEITTLNKIANERLKLIEKVIDCLDNGGLLESEINKRSPFTFLRYHVHFTIGVDGKKKSKVQDLFLTKSSVEGIFNNFRNNGAAIVNGKIIQFEALQEVKITSTLIQENEESIYRKKHYILNDNNDEKFVKSFPDVTKEFYNNDFWANVSHRVNLPKVIEKTKIQSTVKEKHEVKMNLSQINLVINKIKDNIKNDDIKLALVELEGFIEKIHDENLNKEFILLYARFNKEEKDFNRGFGRNVEERNRINSAILNLIDKAEMVSKDNINIKRSPILENLMGHCIRTGVQIPFNLERPLSLDAYLIWSQFGNGDYPEKYCHFSGEPSNGETSFNYPILKKNWLKAKEIHGF